MAVNRFATATLKLILIGLLAVFLSGAGLFSSKDDELATDKNIKSTKPWANIDGFRSAKFGMRMKEVKKAISQDFEISDRKINAIMHPTEQTQSLAVTIEKLLPKSG